MPLKRGWRQTPKFKMISISVEYCIQPHQMQNLLEEDQWTRIRLQILTWVWSGILSLTWSYPSGLMLVYCHVLLIWFWGYMAPPLHKLLVCQLHEKFCSRYLNVLKGDPPMPLLFITSTHFHSALLGSSLLQTRHPPNDSESLCNESRFFKIINY